ncbi:MAG: (Fe-S)-binding protein [Cyclobacteriaceae bacterium]|nr:(Fe-S)-binding protein [Cyclobacteriaceae bacterium]
MANQIKAALFIPCYIDQLYPDVGVATLQLLEKLGVKVEYPQGQTCCGQPMANAGFDQYAQKTTASFYEAFKNYDYIVAPSGSCVAHVRHHLNLPGVAPDTFEGRAFELCEFMHDVLKVKQLEASYPVKVGLHKSCHGLRGLRIGTSSELQVPREDKVALILKMVAGLELISHAREDECCGFGGTFATAEEAVSVAMGNARINGYAKAGAEVITGTDMSCLMHMEGLLKRQQINIQIKHVAEILNSVL